MPPFTITLSFLKIVEACGTVKEELEIWKQKAICIFFSSEVINVEIIEYIIRILKAY